MTTTTNNNLPPPPLPIFVCYKCNEFIDGNPTTLTDCKAKKHHEICMQCFAKIKEEKGCPFCQQDVSKISNYSELKEINQHNSETYKKINKLVKQFTSKLSLVDEFLKDLILTPKIANTIEGRLDDVVNNLTEINKLQTENQIFLIKQEDINLLFQKIPVIINQINSNSLESAKSSLKDLLSLSTQSSKSDFMGTVKTYANSFFTSFTTLFKKTK